MVFLTNITTLVAPILLKWVINKLEQNIEIITQAQKNPTSDEKAGVFVTLKKHHQLRGCIGCITSTEPLLTTIPNFAIKAAIDDPRFQAVTINEISTIEYTFTESKSA